jgi:2-iminoacetate synthase
MTTQRVVEQGTFIDEARIDEALQSAATKDAVRVREILAKARELKGLDMDEVAVLTSISDPELLSELFTAARDAKDAIYGSRLVLFAPLYVSNLCSNDCVYCAFRVRNKELKRRALTQGEIRHEIELLVDQGHKRVLLVAGESYPKQGFGYVLDSIATIYEVKRGNGEIRRVNVNVAPLSVDEFRQLKASGIGTYQLFQETYHRETYKAVHLGGRKRDYDWRVTAMHRAMEAGIDDVGIGVLFGLFDWRFEVMAMLQHIHELETVFGVGPHTISMPRLEPALGSDMASNPPRPVSDVAFRKIVAILRLAVPYTGMIMSTRETANLRRETFALGVSQISAGSRTNPGGYEEDEKFDTAQFQLGDHRNLDEVIRDVAELGYVPSFCTACYRLGRTGMDFMDLAKPGEIKHHCDPNALATFEEYLIDYGTEATRETGETLIARKIAEMDPVRQAHTEKMLDRVRHGERDVLC